jgi:hypothetical protein
VYLNATTVAKSKGLRRVRNQIYTQEFAEILWQELLLRHAKATSTTPQHTLNSQDLAEPAAASS